MIFSDQTTKWSDIDPTWPAEDILRFSPGTDSGTFDYFIEAVMDKQFVVDDATKGKGEEALLKAANLQLSEDDNVLVQGVEGSPNAIGYFGFAYYEENADLLRAVAIEGVEPAAAAVDAGDYPLARPLFIYCWLLHQLLSDLCGRGNHPCWILPCAGRRTGCRPPGPACSHGSVVW